MLQALGRDALWNHLQNRWLQNIVHIGEQHSFERRLTLSEAHESQTAKALLERKR